MDTTDIDWGTLEPTTMLCFKHEGRTATIDFGGDELTYEGDLPVAESAKIFFEAVWGIYKTKVVK